MQTFIQYGVVAALTAALTGGLSWLIGRARPSAFTSESGTIAPEKWSALLTVVLGAIMALGGGVAVLAGAWPVGLIVFLIGAAISGFMAPSLTNVHILTWSRNGVEGPSKTFGPTLGLEKTTILWGDIQRMGKTATSYWYIESKDGRRIYWSFLYKGYQVFIRELRIRRPTLILPNDVGA